MFPTKTQSIELKENSSNTSFYYIYNKRLYRINLMEIVLYEDWSGW